MGMTDSFDDPSQAAISVILPKATSQSPERLLCQKQQTKKPYFCPVPGGAIEIQLCRLNDDMLDWRSTRRRNGARIQNKLSMFGCCGLFWRHRGAEKKLQAVPDPDTAQLDNHDKPVRSILGVDAGSRIAGS